MKEGQILVRVEDKEDGIEVIIKDTGCGIAKKNMPQLFKPFFTTKELGQGTGLGLATSFKIVQSWGGSLRAESEMGKGATFIIHLHKGA